MARLPHRAPDGVHQDAPGVFLFLLPESMKALNDTTTPNASEEVLISRELIFRNSTFGALKTFMRDHKRRTGVALNNAAAVDIILRAHLARHIHPDAVKTMMNLSSPASARALQEASQDDPREDVTERVAKPLRQGPPVIRVALPTHRRAFLKPLSTPQDGQA